MEAGIDFVAVDMPQANRLTIHIMAAMAEHEADAISTRTKAALAAARARGTQLGGDRGNFTQVRSLGPAVSCAVRTASASKWANDVLPLVEELRRAGASFRAIAAELTERGIPARRGGDWTGTQVARVVANGAI